MIKHRQSLNITLCLPLLCYLCTHLFPDRKGLRAWSALAPELLKRTTRSQFYTRSRLLLRGVSCVGWTTPVRQQGASEARNDHGLRRVQLASAALAGIDVAKPAGCHEYVPRDHFWMNFFSRL